MHKFRVYILILFIIHLLINSSADADTTSTTPAATEFLDGNYTALFDRCLTLAANDPTAAYLPLLIAEKINRQFLADNSIGNRRLLDLAGVTDLPPLCRYLVKELLARNYAAAGKEYQASNLRAENGIIPSWRIAGAFGEHDTASFYQVFPPERGIDFSIFMPGLGKDVTWRLLGENICLNNFIPYKWMTPQHGVLYLYTQFKLDVPQRIILEKEGSGVFSFWVDGIAAGGTDYTETDPSINCLFRSPTPLAAGWHRLLIKLSTRNYDTPEIFRLLDADFKPIENIRYDLKELHGKNSFGKEEWQRVEQPLIDDYTPAEKALFYQYLQQYDQALQLWDEAIAADPDDPVLHLHYATCAAQASAILPGPLRSSIIRREALKTLELEPQAISALIILGDHERQNNRINQANAYYQRALELNPTALIAHTLRLRMAINNAWNPEIHDWLPQLERLYPQSYIASLLTGIYFNSSGQIKQAAGSLEKAFTQDQANLTIATDTLKSYFLAGDTEQALKIIEMLPSYYRQRRDILLLKAEILARFGDYQGAITTLAKSLQAVGKDPEILKAEGDILYSSKAYSAALTKYQESLELDGGNYTLRRLIAELEGKDYRFWKNYTLDARAKIDEFSKKHTSYIGSTARLIDQTVLQIYPGGGHSNYTHELQAVLTERGVNQAAIVDTYGELLQARTILPEHGISLEPNILNKTAPNITMPAVAPGAVIEHAYLDEHATPADRCLRFPKWYFRSPSNQESFLFSQYIIRVPKGVDFAYASRNLGDKVKLDIIENDDGSTDYIFTGTDMPEAIHEEGSPAISSTLPYVAVASKQDWEDIHYRLLNTYLGQTNPTQAIQKQAEALTANCPTLKDKITALYSYVNAEITPNHSIAPASHIFLQKTGNKNHLLLAMLRSCGIKAELVAVRPPANIIYDPIWKLPATNSFIDYLIRAESDNNEYLWLDTRARYGGAGEIGEDLAGGTGLTLGLNNCEFITLPPALEYSYTINRERNYQLATTAPTIIDGEINYYGTRAWEYKENLINLNSDLRLGVFETILANSLLGISITDFELPNLEEAGTGLTFNYQASIDDFLKENINGEFAIPLALPTIELLPTKDANERRTPYHQNKFLAANDRYIYNLPAGARVSKLPENVVIRSKFGYYSLNFSQDNKRIILERKYNFLPQIIALDDWQDYFKLAQNLKQIENDYIWFKE